MANEWSDYHAGRIAHCKSYVLRCEARYDEAQNKASELCKRTSYDKSCLTEFGIAIRKATEATCALRDAESDLKAAEWAEAQYLGRSYHKA